MIWDSKQSVDGTLFHLVEIEMDAMRSCDRSQKSGNISMTIPVIVEQCVGDAQAPAARTRLPQNARFVGALTEATFRTLG
jgi:hypothetical protein